MLFGYNVQEEDLIINILFRLPAEYDAAIAIILNLRNRESLNIHEVQSILVSQELELRYRTQLAQLTCQIQL